MENVIEFDFYHGTFVLLDCAFEQNSNPMISYLKLFTQ